MDHYLLDEFDNPYQVGILAHSILRFKKESKIVALTEINEKERLSTVFLSLDHSFSHSKDHTPVLFESMWFGGLNDGDQRRYETYEQALKGHLEMLKEAGFLKD